MATTISIVNDESWNLLIGRLKKTGRTRRFKLGPADRQYMEERGMDLVYQHARDFVDRRLRRAHPRNDGQQTPLRGHPVFLAQHATGTYCRGSLERFHGIAPDHELSRREMDYVVGVIMRWLEEQRTEASAALLS